MGTPALDVKVADAATILSGGLSSDDARRRLKQEGENAITDVVQHPVQRALGKLWAPVPWMLEAAILLQLGLKEFAEAGVVAFLLLFNAGLGFIQEGRAQATLDALKSKLALSASVLRDGKWTSVPAATLVKDDLVKLSLGAVVAADVRLVSGSVLVDQSMLTGESLPVDVEAGSVTYAGALIQRGEAVGQVTATGSRTKFGKTADLVRSAKVESSEQKAIFRVVRNLALFNGAITVLLTLYALFSPIPRGDIVPLILVAVLASIPVALPSMFTLAAAVGARALARKGVLPTSLSAVDEAASIDILCADKTGTLTRNTLTVTSVSPMPAVDGDHLLNLAALASSDGGQDPVDAAIRTASLLRPVASGLKLLAFTPFDPALKRAEAKVAHDGSAMGQILKGAFSVIEPLAAPSPGAKTMATGLEAQGFRVLAVAFGAEGALKLMGFIALSDPPREDSAALVAQLAALGVQTVMVTGDAKATAKVVATAIGIRGKVYAISPLPETLKAEDYAVFAGVLPEDKYSLVKALQKDGHLVGMCGDGANDAPALRQAQMGIAVLTATDVAKSAAGMVLTEAGLGGVVAAVTEGRATFQRILTYTLRSIIHKVAQVLFLAAGLVMTGQAILTPMLMVLMMVTGDVLSMSSSTDNVRPSPKPSVWRIGHLTLAGVVMGGFDLLFCIACFATGKFALGLGAEALRTMTVVTLVFSGQAVFYVSRERLHVWSSMPGRWLIVSSVVDLTLITVLASNGLLMAALPPPVIAGVFGAAVIFCVLLDSVKLALFRRLQID